MEWLTIAAIILGPILAVQAQKWIERKSTRKERRLALFKALMSTRATRLSPLHVEALNMIDIEYYDNQKIVDAWHLLSDLFDNYPKNIEDPNYQAQLLQCSEKSNDLLTDLLYEMAQSLDFKFDKVLLKRGAYNPIGHGKLEIEQQFIRQSLVELFSDKKAIPFKVVNLPQQVEKQ
jgi:hypothetical protein